jgi:hypothetical protein
MVTRLQRTAERGTNASSKHEKGRQQSEQEPEDHEDDEHQHHYPRDRDGRAHRKR